MCFLGCTSCKSSSFTCYYFRSILHILYSKLFKSINNVLLYGGFHYFSLFFIPEYSYVPSSEYIYMYGTYMVERNWFFFNIWSFDVENLEVNSFIAILKRFINSFSYIFFRISIIFRVRSAKAVKITDMNLLKRLGVILAIFSALLIIRTLVAPPHVIVRKTAEDLKAYLCKTDWWDHSFTTSTL